MKRKLIILIAAMLFSSTAVAQVEVESNNILHRVKKIADATMVQGVDTNYVKTPSQPWQVSIKSRMAQTDLQMHSAIDGGELLDGEGMMPLIMGVGDMATHPRIMTRMSTSMGVKVGYKGISVSYSFPVGGDKGQNLSLKTAGSRYSLNLRWHKFETDKAKVRYVGAAKGRWVEDFDEQTGEVRFTDWSEPVAWEETYNEQLSAPMTIQTLIFDGFYIFNHKRFSYAAAYNQKTFQVRSAGSPIAGLMGYYADFDYDQARNAGLIYAMDGIGRLRQYQLSLGAGYAYNYVPAKGWLVSGMFMPMLTMLNRTRINTYTSNFKDVSKEHLLELVLSEEEDAEYPDVSDEYQIESQGVHSSNNRLALNFTTRLSVTYNWNRYFINANGQFNNFNFKHKAMHGHLNDWYINASVGVRL